MKQFSARATRPLLLGLTAIALVATPVLASPRPRLIWNVSASVPTGLYLITYGDQLARGRIVAVEPPPAIASLMLARNYLGEGVPLLKTMAALGGDKVCRNGEWVSVNGRAVARALPRDRLGRPLPVWRGCQRLAADEMFLINAPADSFDSRYFGPLPTSSVIGRARLLYATGAGQ